MKIIKFEEKEFPSVIINLPCGDRKISTLKLNELLMNIDGSYVSDEARLIDEGIFYFVKEDVLSFPEDKLVAKILLET